MKVFLDEHSKAIRVAGLVFCDILILNIASFLALWVRFDCTWSQIPRQYFASMYRCAIIYTIMSLIVFMVFNLYETLWEYASVYELTLIAAATAMVACLQFGMMGAIGYQMPRSYFLLCFVFNFILIAAIRFVYRFARFLRAEKRIKSVQDTRAMIIGAGDAGNIILREILNSNYLNGRVECLIDDDKRKQGRVLNGVEVFGGRDKIQDAVDKFGITHIIIAIPSADAADRRDIIRICQRTGCKLRILPGIYQMVNGQVAVSKLRDVRVEDLLERDPIKVDLDKIAGYVTGKVVLITGGGSIGSELCRQIAQYEPKQLIIFDIYENNAYDIQQDLRIHHPELNLVVLIGSVRNAKRLEWIFKTYRPELLYHAAAHKHVPLMEDSPNEAIKNNVMGTLTTARLAAKYGTSAFVMISTDKAVNPTNIMGASKRLCEMIIQCMERKYPGTKFVAVRFGNVLGSNGSVIPLFQKQIAEGGPVTVTHPDIIRYFMTIPEAVALVLQAGGYAKGGEIFVLDMGEPVKIMDLAKNMISMAGYTLGEDMEIKITGLRPGEKLYEEMLMDEEGLTDTDNHRIHIGRPIPLDDELFLKKLSELDEASYQESADIRHLVKELVPEYQMPEERQ